MPPTDDERKAIEEAAKGSRRTAQVLLDTECQAIMSQVARLQELKPQTADAATYQKLIDVVQDACTRNLAVADLKKNVQNLGEGAVKLFGEVVQIAKSRGLA
jgi:hypothetical protein